MLLREYLQGLCAMTNYHFSPFQTVICLFISLLKNVGQIRQSCIACICFNFPHCVFSSVSSNYLPLGKQSHIGCISLTFPHCAFSYDPSKRLHKRKQSHIGCIFVTFLHCAFSNVASNRLYEKWYNHIGCICLISSTVHFQMNLQILCIGECKVTLVAYV